MTNVQTESRFNMWRSVVAMAHADGVVTSHELSFINDYIKDIEFSKEQLDIIGDDLRNPKDIKTSFDKILEPQDQKDFFALARALSWCDGDYDAQEKSIIDFLEKQNLMNDGMQSLKESRYAYDEIELEGNQWGYKNKGASHNNPVFNFVSKILGRRYW